MTDAEKADVYDEVVQLLQDGIALEKHFLSKGKDWDAIQSVRANAYQKIVIAILGADALRA